MTSTVEKRYHSEGLNWVTTLREVATAIETGVTTPAVREHPSER